MKAYGFDQNGEIHECPVVFNYDNNYYEVSPPDNAFFSGDTVCYLNGDMLGRGFTNGDDSRFEFDSGIIAIQSKEPGSYSVVKFESSKYGTGYIKLTYDNGATRLLFENGFENNGIEKAGDFASAGELENEFPQFDSEAVSGLEFDDGCKYSVLIFDATYIFAKSVSDGKRYLAVKNETCTYMLIVTRSLLPEIDLTEMVRVTAAWFDMIINILQNLVMNISVR